MGTQELIENFLEKNEHIKMSFGLEYSSVIDWVAEFVPRRGHPLAREYNGPWRASGGTMHEAVRRAIEKCEGMLAEAQP